MGRKDTRCLTFLALALCLWSCHAQSAPQGTVAQPAAQVGKTASKKSGSRQAAGPPALEVLWNGEQRIVNVLPPPRADAALGLEPYVVAIPDNISPMPVPADNPLTHAGVSLGRYLFYDSILSGNQTQSCASCHEQALSFTDGKAVSVGSEGRAVTRNSMPLVNLAWTAPYFWDNRAQTLEDLALMPIIHKDELNLSLDEAVVRLKSHAVYPARFASAFPSEEISEETLAKALAQFLRTLVSFNAPADMMEQNPQVLSPMAIAGDKILTDGLPKNDPDPIVALCDGCHTANTGVKGERAMGLFTSLDTKRNGIEVKSDYGFEAVSGDASDRGRFSVPSARNISVTGPYMHDGRFETLLDVLSHYNSEMSAVTLPDAPLSRDGKPLRLLLDESDKLAVVAFLGMLTDEFFLSNPAFADPFSAD